MVEFEDRDVLAPLALSARSTSGSMSDIQESARLLSYDVSARGPRRNFPNVALVSLGLGLAALVCLALVGLGRGHQWRTPLAHLRGMAVVDGKSEDHSSHSSSSSSYSTRESTATQVPSFCGKIEHGVEYHTRRPLYLVSGIQTPEMCCAECDGDPQCGAWTWGRHGDWNGLRPTCLLKKLEEHEQPTKINRTGVASGLQRLSKHGIVAALLAKQASAGENVIDWEASEAGIAPNATCRGDLNVEGYGTFSVVNALWQTPGVPASAVEVPEKSWAVIPHLKGRAYFAEGCTPAEFNRSAYASWKLLGRTIQYTVDLSGVGCGCNAKLHLVPMRQNQHMTACDDYFCSVANVCGVTCAELGLQDANQYAWSSTLHVHDHLAGVSVGYGGSGWTGRRDWSDAEYGPGAECIDTTWPFQVSISFPVDKHGTLKAMEVTLSQEGHFCPLKARVDKYHYKGRDGLKELSKVLEEGMTPFVSYSSSSKMEVFDGVGSDGEGPCVKDTPEACPKLVRFFDFSVNDTIVESSVISAALSDSQSPIDTALDELHVQAVHKANENREAALANATKLRDIAEGVECGDCDTPGMTITDSTNGDDGGKEGSGNVNAYTEVKQGNVEWEVLFKRLPVRQTAKFDAEVLEVKIKGMVLQGQRQEGDWIKLAHEPGYVAIGRHGASFVRERMVTYTKIASGNCPDQEMYAIRDVDTCRSAAFALGYFDPEVNVYPGNKSRPEGCYLSDGHLWLATHQNNTGHGVDGNRFPICGTLSYPTTTTTTTTTTTSTMTLTTTATTTTSTTWGWPSLFCFAVMRRYGCGPEDCYEYGLMRAQVNKSAGIFLCDEYGVFSQDENMSLGQIRGDGAEVTTEWFQQAPVGRSDDGFAANTLLFMHVWEAVYKDHRWAVHDWTVKADPDAVVLPWRIRDHVRPITGWKNYVPNCNAFPTSPLFPMVYGSFEAFSKMSMEAYFDKGGGQKCNNDLQWWTWGEDKFMGECMKHLGVSQSTDLSILADKRCGGGSDCGNGVAAAYHDFKSIPAWFTCWGQATDGTKYAR